MIYSNQLSQIAAGNPAVIELTEEEAWQTAWFSPLRTTWPAKDQIANSFFYGNVLNGSDATPPRISATSNATIFIKENRDFWLQQPNSTNGVPAGARGSYLPLAYPHPWVAAETPPASPTGVESGPGPS